MRREFASDSNCGPHKVALSTICAPRKPVTWSYMAKNEKKMYERAEEATPRQPQAHERTFRRVGTNIQRFREARKWKLAQLAGRAGVDTSTVSRLERGGQGFSEESLAKLAQALSVDVSDFFQSLTELPELIETGAVVMPWCPHAPMPAGASRFGAAISLSWLPQDVNTANLCALHLPGSERPYVVVDSSQLELLDDRRIAFLHRGSVRVRRTFWRFDGALRLVCEGGQGSVPEEVVPPDQLGALRALGRIIWAGGPV